MDLSSLNESLEQAEQYYLNGQYPTYKVSLDKIREELNDSAFPDLDASTLSSILENNLLVAECLELKWETENAKETWDRLLLRFGSIHQRCTDTYLKIASHEFRLQLTLVHNYLFWSLFNPHVERGNNNRPNHIEDNLQLVIRCMHFVLESFDKTCLAVEHSSSEMIALQLMKLSCTGNILFYAEGTHNIGLQLLEIYFLSIQIIIESFDSTSTQSDRKSLQACADLIQTIVNLKHSFKTCTRTYIKEENNCRSTCINVSQFKFGLHRINSRVGDFHFDAIFNALCFAGSLCYLKMEQFKPSLACLSQPSTTCENDGMPSFILNYLKSWIYFRLKHFDKSLLFLRKILDLPLDCNMMARSLLLHGLILLYNGQFLKAQSEFVKVTKIDSYLPLALYYSALTYKSYAESHLHDEEVSIQRDRQSEDQRKRFREAVPISDVHLNALNALVRSLKDRSISGIKINNYSASLELKFLSIMHPQPEITAFQAIYLLARELTARRKYTSSADKLLYLLKVERDYRLDHVELELSTPVPPTNTLMHETTAVLIQSERWSDAEIVCYQLLSASANPAEALIPNMFLAQIQEYKEEEDDALSTLIVCLNSVDQWVAQNGTEYLKNEEPEPTCREVGDRIAAKVCLQIALIFIDRQSPLTAEKHLRRALCYSKVDKDALYHLILLLKNHITTSHKLWERHRATFDIVDTRFTNIALDYILRSHVTKEERETLFVRFLTSIPKVFENLEDMNED